eukprot:480378-Prymnesium_polylepis.2
MVRRPHTHRCACLHNTTLTQHTHTHTLVRGHVSACHGGASSILRTGSIRTADFTETFQRGPWGGTDSVGRGQARSDADFTVNVCVRRTGLHKTDAVFGPTRPPWPRRISHVVLVATFALRCSFNITSWVFAAPHSRCLGVSAMASRQVSAFKQRRAAERPVWSIAIVNGSIKHTRVTPALGRQGGAGERGRAEGRQGHTSAGVRPGPASLEHHSGLEADSPLPVGMHVTQGAAARSPHLGSADVRGCEGTRVAGEGE